MTRHSRNLALLAIIAAGLMPATAALAQSYGAAYAPPPPLYPYVMQPSQPYAVRVAPNTYAIQRPAHTRDHSRSRRGAVAAAHTKAAPRFDRPHKSVNRKLVEELRKRSQKNGAVVNSTKIVRDAPVVAETKRYVDDPPRVIERPHVAEDAPAQSRRGLVTNDDVDTGQAASPDDGKQRVIHADAEVTIIGPDRMNIRLYRKRHGPKAKAPAGE